MIFSRTGVDVDVESGHIVVSVMAHAGEADIEAAFTAARAAAPKGAEWDVHFDGDAFDYVCTSQIPQ